MCYVRWKIGRWPVSRCSDHRANFVISMAYVYSVVVATHYVLYTLWARTRLIQIWILILGRPLERTKAITGGLPKSPRAKILPHAAWVTSIMLSPVWWLLITFFDGYIPVYTILVGCALIELVFLTAAKKSWTSNQANVQEITVIFNSTTQELSFRRSVLKINLHKQKIIHQFLQTLFGTNGYEGQFDKSYNCLDCMMCWTIPGKFATKFCKTSTGNDTTSLVYFVLVFSNVEIALFASLGWGRNFERPNSLNLNQRIFADLQRIVADSQRIVADSQRIVADWISYKYTAANQGIVTDSNSEYPVNIVMEQVCNGNRNFNSI